MSQRRIDLLLEELVGIHWDIRVLVETWREAVREDFLLEDGHYWYGSGGRKFSCGIGFIVNGRHLKHKFVPVSTRLAYLDIKLAIGSCRIFGIYMPDSSHSDQEVDLVYAQLQSFLGMHALGKYIVQWLVI